MNDCCLIDCLSLSFQLHVCGSVSGRCSRIGEKEPSVCLGDTTLGEVNTVLEYAASGFLTLTYRGQMFSSGRVIPVEFMDLLYQIYSSVVSVNICVLSGMSCYGR